jgi:hypothetical protein
MKKTKVKDKTSVVTATVTAPKEEFHGTCGATRSSVLLEDNKPNRVNQHVINVCKLGQGNECCRYLVMGSLGFECAKNTSMRSTIDNRVDMNAMVAQGNNCEGQPMENLK